MLPEHLLTQYTQEFYGVGNENAKIWFVGIEEAGGINAEDVERRFRTWQQRRQRPFENALDFFLACGNHKWHGPGAVVQRTWRQLIRLILLARGRSAAEEAVLNYQRTCLGAMDGETCLAELLPLPSPSTADWKYGDWSDLPWLQSRDAYLDKILPSRITMFRDLVAKHKPRLVLFYGTTLPSRSLLPSWSEIAGGRFGQAIENEESLLWRKNNGTEFFVVRHPSAESDAYFGKIGKYFQNERPHLFNSCE